MKKIPLFLIPFLIVCQSLFAALSTGTTFEVRPTNGDDTNGGGYRGSPFITNTPSAPSVAMGGNGTVAVDVYYIVVAFADGFGTGPVSAESSLDVNSTSTDIIVVTSPAVPAGGHANYYNTYIGTVSGGPYYYQAQTALGTNYSRTTTPATSGVQPAGADYTQQNAAQLSLTDLACAEASNTTLTSATGGFTAAMIGNLVRINSGTNFTVGYYEITGYTDTNTVTIDRDPTDGDGGDGSSGVGKVGGALATLDQQTTTSAFDAAVTESIFMVKNEAGWNEAVTHASTKTIVVIGYNTTRLDDPTGANRPALDRADAAGDAFALSGQGLELRNLIIKQAGDDAISAAAAYITFVLQNVRLTDNLDEGIDSGGNRQFIGVLINCEIDNNAGSGIYAWSANNDGHFYVFGSSFHDNTAGNTFSFNTMANNLFYDHSADAVYAANISSLFINNTIDGNTGANVDGYVAAGLGYTIANNIFSNNGAYGVVTPISEYSHTRYIYNDYYGNTTGTVSGGHYSLDSTDQTLDPQFTSTTDGSEDFSIGTNLKAKGFPGAMQSGGTGYMDIGALQRQEPTGGSSTDVLGAIQ